MYVTHEMPSHKVAISLIRPRSYSLLLLLLHPFTPSEQISSTIKRRFCELIFSVVLPRAQIYAYLLLRESLYATLEHMLGFLALHAKYLFRGCTFL